MVTIGLKEDAMACEKVSRDKRETRKRREEGVMDFLLIFIR